MKQYYLLKLLSNDKKIQKRILYKTEFTRPYCIIKILSKNEFSHSHYEDIKDTFFILTDNAEYLSNFVYIEIDKIVKTHRLFYNKSNFIYGNYVTDACFILLSSKNFDKYYSFDTPETLVNYNFISCDIYIYSNLNCCYIRVAPYYELSISKSNKEFIETIRKYICNYSHIVIFKQFKEFNTFRELILHCIELDRKYFFSKHKDLSKNEKLIFNDYYDILIDVANGIEL